MQRRLIIHIGLYTVIYFALTYIIALYQYNNAQSTLYLLPGLMALEILLLTYLIRNNIWTKTPISYILVVGLQVVMSIFVAWNVIWFIDAIYMLEPSHNINGKVFFTGIVLCNMFYIILIQNKHQLHKSVGEIPNTALEHNLQLKNEAELYKLRQQVNPHFLFNALNSILALNHFDQKKSTDMIHSLSEYFRHSIQKQDQSEISLKDEVDDIKLYLSIEMIRFGHRLKVTEDIDQDILHRQIPPLVLQPLIENAIKYGIYGTGEEVHIHIQIKNTLDKNGIHFTECTISNPYDPSLKFNTGTGFGLAGIKRRLYLIYNRNDLLRVNADQDTNGSHQFFTILSIPYFNHHSNDRK